MLLLQPERPHDGTGIDLVRSTDVGGDDRVVAWRPDLDCLSWSRLELMSAGLEDAIDLLGWNRCSIDDEPCVIPRLEVQNHSHGSYCDVLVTWRERLHRIRQIRGISRREEEDCSSHDRNERDSKEEIGDAVAGGRHRRDATSVSGKRYRLDVDLNPVLSQLGHYPIAMVARRAAERRERGLPVIDFSIGDPREPTPAFIADALRSGVPEVSQYPTAAGRKDLREAIAAYVWRRFGVEVDAETQVLPTSGSKEAIFSTPFAFVDRTAADVVVFPSPGYPVYERGAMFAGAALHRVVLGADFVMRATDIPPEVMEKAKLVWLCTPHNPSGAVTTNADLADLVTACAESGTLLLSDECYSDVYEDDAFPGGPASVLQAAPEGCEGVLSYLSLSKRSGMTGYRSGAVVGDAEAIDALKSLRSTTGTASADFVQSAAIAAWGDDGHAADRRAIFTAKREILARAFASAGMDIVASRAGLYLWARVGDDAAVTDKLLDHGIVVSPGSAFGEGGEGYIRLALVPTLGECEAAAAALEHALV